MPIVLEMMKINSGKTTFCHMFVLRKGILSFTNLFLVSILQYGGNSEFFLDNKDKCYRQI